jgi:hypothetical protein
MELKRFKDDWFGFNERSMKFVKKVIHNCAVHSGSKILSELGVKPYQMN